MHFTVMQPNLVGASKGKALAARNVPDPVTAASTGTHGAGNGNTPPQDPTPNSTPTQIFCLQVRHLLCPSCFSLIGLDFYFV